MDSGPEIARTFDPFPLYKVMETPGFERRTEKAAESGSRAFFYRTELRQNNGESPCGNHDRTKQR